MLPFHPDSISVTSGLVASRTRRNDTSEGQQLRVLPINVAAAVVSSWSLSQTGKWRLNAKVVSLLDVVSGRNPKFFVTIRALALSRGSLESSATLIRRVSYGVPNTIGAAVVTGEGGSARRGENRRFPEVLSVFVIAAAAVTTFAAIGASVTAATGDFVVAAAAVTGSPSMIGGVGVTGNAALGAIGTNPEYKKISLVDRLP